MVLASALVPLLPLSLLLLEWNEIRRLQQKIYLPGAVQTMIEALASSFFSLSGGRSPPRNGGEDLRCGRGVHPPESLRANVAKTLRPRVQSSGTKSPTKKRKLWSGILAALPGRSWKQLSFQGSGVQLPAHAFLAAVVDMRRLAFPKPYRLGTPRGWNEILSKTTPHPTRSPCAHDSTTILPRT